MARSNTEVIKTQAAFEAQIDRAAELQLDIVCMKAARDEEKEAVLAQWNNDIKAIEAELLAVQTRAQSYAELHWKELGGDSRSASTALANYGFRTGLPTVKLIKRQKESDVAEQLAEEGYSDLVEVGYKLNKAAVKKALEAGVSYIAQLFRIDQKTRFFVEAKSMKED